MIDYLYLALVGGIVGVARAGIAAFANLATPILTMHIPSAKEATGLIVAISIIGDIIALAYYHRKIIILPLIKIMPISFVGMLIAVLTGKYMSNQTYLVIITALSGIAWFYLVFSWIQKHRHIKSHSKETFLQEFLPLKNQPNTRDENLETANTNLDIVQDAYPAHHSKFQHYIILYICGILAGIGTVLGNSAAIFVNLYLFELNLKKNEFIGTLSMYFFIVNLLKIFMHLFYWNSIDVPGLFDVLKISIFILIGFFCGILFVRRLHEKGFTRIIIFSSTISFLLLLWKTINSLQ